MIIKCVQFLILNKELKEEKLQQVDELRAKNITIFLNKREKIKYQRLTLKTL